MACIKISYGADAHADYVKGAGLSLARIKKAGPIDITDYLHPDHLGSNVAATNSSGNIKWIERFTPFGEEINDNPANDNQAGFTGHIKDAATGLNYMQARYYDPVIGRFLSIDPVTFMSTGNPAMFNRYAYTFNDPVNLIDPDGNHPVLRKLGMKVGKKSLKKRLLSSTNLSDTAVDVLLTDFSDPQEVTELALGKLKKIKKARQLAKNKAKGKQGENLTEAKLGDDLAGTQVTLESSKGTRARIDSVKKDGGLVETKTGDAGLSRGQQDVFDDVEAGRPVIPRGANAERAGLVRDQPVKLPSCSIDRPC